MATPTLRKTRIVCISDTHNCTVKLPAGDVLIHAGDLTNQGSFSEVSCRPFFAAADAQRPLTSCLFSVRWTNQSDM